MSCDAAVEAGARAASARVELDYDTLAEEEQARARELACAVIDAALPHLLEELTQRHHLVEQFSGGLECSCGKDRFCRDLRILEGLLEDKT